VPISIPNSYVNPNVRTVGISKLRSLNATKLRDIDKTLVIQENDQPLAVLLKYDEYLAMQKQLIAVLETQAVLSDKDAVTSILSGKADVRSGNTRSIEDVRDSVRKNKKKA
jgi:PHD/YefM family antitoxin component YafN of YafNO toxin-antitoxin module